MLYPLLTLCIIAQLCAVSLFTMHKSDFFHFLHKRENPSFLAFGQNDSFWLGRGSFVHTVYVFKVVFLCFLKVFVVFRCHCMTCPAKIHTPCKLACNNCICLRRFSISFAAAHPSWSGQCAFCRYPRSAP